MRVLVTWGSKRGGTEGISRILAEALEQHGFEVVAAPAAEVRGLDTFDAVIVGGALYANRWPANVRRFVNRHIGQLRKVPVWFFSSGPLDDTAEHEDIAATNQVGVLAERVGAKGHVTFGGRLEPTTKGFPAAAMAKTHSGDWRNPDRVRAWAAELSASLPSATPGTAVEPLARTLSRLLAHAAVGGLLCATTLGLLLRLAGTTAALVVHGIFAPLALTMIATRYFRPRGAREPLQTAMVFTAAAALLDVAIVAGVSQHGLPVFAGVGVWLPLALALLFTWATGALMSTMPWPKVPQASET